MQFVRVLVAGWLTIAPAMMAHAGVSAQESDALHKSLTPLGAERAGNREGTIPSWTGGYTSVPAGWHAGDARPDPFAAEKPVLTITAANMAAYADKLPEGAKLLFKRFPDYRMEVFASHRTAAAPQWMYDNTYRNALRAHAAPEGIVFGVEGAAGGIPFPIPKNAPEAVWNHLLAFWGPARELHLKTFVASGNAIDMTSSYNEIADFPYYYPNATPESYGGYYFKTLHRQDGPPASVGEGYLDWQPINTRRYDFAAWRLLPGERRVRRGPALSYDTPDPEASGFESLDEYYIFFGGLDRYDWKILGKKEMYVPYNDNRFYALPTKQIMGPNHANPDAIRYELHRVWVIDATLAAGKHHVVPHRRLYLDEDTWFAVYSDSWDDKGNLWKFGQGTPYLMPDVPAVILGSQFIYDFDVGGYMLGFAFNNEPGQYRITAPHAPATFTPESMAAHAVR